MVNFLESTWTILLELAPWLLLGALIAGVLHVVLPVDFLKRQFNGSLGVVKAVLFGVPLPLCSCSVIPVGLSLKRSGASRGSTVAFLISTPQTGVDSILVAASFLGWPFAVFKVLAAAVTGVFGGWWTDQEPPTPTLPVLDVSAQSSEPSESALARLWHHSLDLLHSIWRWLILGVLVSAAIEAFVPTGTAASMTGNSDLLAMLLTLLISLPLYVCATASVPIAAALVGNGLPVGAALVFLMAGPATNVATIGAVYRTLGRRALTIYLATVVVGSVLSGWLFGFLLDSSATTSAHHHNTDSWLATTSATLFLVLVAWFAIGDARRYYSLQKHSEESTTSESSCCHN